MKYLLPYHILLIQLFYCSTIVLGQCFDEFCIPSNYSRLSTPLINGSNAINVEIYDLQILKVNDLDSTIDLSFVLYLGTIHKPRIVQEGGYKFKNWGYTLV